MRASGPGGLFVEDYLPFKGESEWLEIDSNEIMKRLCRKKHTLHQYENVDFKQWQLIIFNKFNNGINKIRVYKIKEKSIG